MPELTEYENLALRNLDLEGQVVNMRHAFKQHEYRAALKDLYADEIADLYTKLRDEPRWWPIRLRWRWGRWDAGDRLFLRWAISDWYGKTTVVRVWRLAIVLGDRPDLVMWKRSALEATREQRIKELQDRMGIVEEPDDDED